MKKAIIVFAFVMLGFSNALLASSQSNLLYSYANNFEELLAVQIPYKCPASSTCSRPRRGPPGPQGIQGPPGPEAPPFATFISLYALEQQVIAPLNPILFDAVSAQNGSIIWPGANNGEIIVSRAGTYQISFGIQPLFTARVSLRVNNVNVPGGTLNIDLSIPFSGLTIDVVLPANSTISVVNTSNAPLTLQSGGPDPEATIAFIEIHRIL